MESRTRLLLTCSLGGLLALTAGTGVAALTIFHRIRTGEADLRQRFFERSARLEQIRRDIYLSGTLARDYFAEPDGADAAALLDRLGNTERDSKAALDQYDAELRGEVIAYWKVLGLMAEMARKRHGAGVDAYFRHQLALRRETMLHIADGIGAALDREWTRGQAELAAMYSRFRLIFSAGLALVVALGLAVSIGAVRRLVRLEAEARSLAAQLVRAQEEERQAIARELHDEIGQALSGVMLDLGRADAPREAIAASVERIVDELRRIALSLRPSMLDDLGLVPALEWQAREVGGRTGLSVQIQAEESAGDLPEAHRTCIYRVVQEALQNIARHAGAKRVRIGLQKAAESVSLRVEDDGKGFAVARSRGLGLLGMEERVAQLGGRLRVQSEPGRGTTVTAELPL
jgi:signal transduction histidine kinase